METLHDAYMNGYNGKPSKYLWSSNMAEAHFLGECCKKAGFPAAEKIKKSRGSSYRLNDSRTAVIIEYSGEEMSCEINTVFGKAHYSYQ